MLNERIRALNDLKYAATINNHIVVKYYFFVFLFGKTGFLPVLWHISVYSFCRTIILWRKNKWWVLFIDVIIHL